MTGIVGVRPGRFIVLEGGEASGKTTQLQLLTERLRTSGREVVATFEPGDTTLGRELRRLILETDGPIDRFTETLLLAADRVQHVAEVISRAVNSGLDVVCDRYVPSSLVYQGWVRDVPISFIEAVNQTVPEPDLVIVLDVPDRVAEARLGRPTDRMEREGEDFHHEVREGYRKLAEDRGWVLVDASRAPDQVADDVWTVVSERLGASP
jgi:dTMP kinase